MTILVLTTGGTIGAMPYDDIRHQAAIKTMPKQGRDIVRETLEKDFSTYAMRIVTLEHRDSSFIDDAYRQNIADMIAAAPERAVLITHGTDTMLQTAQFLQQQAALAGKTIILTGAMVALSCGVESEALANLDYSLMQLASPLQAGIYTVLSDYEDAATESGWSPRLYPFAPGKYAKTKNPDKMHRNRLYLAEKQEER